MQEIPLNADGLVSALLALSATQQVCILDSCGVGHLGSHLLIAGIGPIETLEISDSLGEGALETLERCFSDGAASIFTLSYELGLKLQRLESSHRSVEPDLFIARFDTLIIHDYDAGSSFLVGNSQNFSRITAELLQASGPAYLDQAHPKPVLRSNFTPAEYTAAIAVIKERIRRGDTYQTNLTKQITAELPAGLAAGSIFARIRRDHPAPFAAFIDRKDSTVVSASPERFFRIEVGPDGRKITTSPIKGTRPRGRTHAEDNALKAELLASQKDRAENTMIVDLLRNDLGRVCEYGSVRVEALCELEEHPSLYHLVSTVSGDLRSDATVSEILRALFPCGSVTGAPKISTMRIIDEIEPSSRGLSMGAIGVHIPPGRFGSPGTMDLSVAIRTMVIRERTATFNVGGGIVIDSDPESEYAETQTKAISLLQSIGAGPGKI